MAGFGLDGFGGGPFGLGTPPGPSLSPTGSAGSRFIHPVNRDYEVSATTGQYKQMPGVRQRVTIAALTQLNSSGIPGFGMKLPEKMGPTFEAECRAAVANGLRHMPDIRLESVTVERGPGGRARITVSWKDLATGESDSAIV